MANKFTSKAQSALEKAHEEARSLGHTYIGSEHILIGLISEGDSVASKMLLSKGIDADILRKTVVGISGQGARSNVSASDMTPRCKRIIEESAQKSHECANGYIGTEHILYALLCEKDCVGVKLLENFGLSVSELKVELQTFFGIDTEKRSGSSGGKDKKNSAKIAGAPTLSVYGRDLTALAASGKADPVIGREEETQRVIRILSRRTKNNPCLVGEPGVGKTAVIEGLAQQISDGNVPETLLDRRIVTLDIPAMIAGAKYRGEFEERMKSVMEEVSKNPDIILFVDEIHMIIGAGAAEGAVDAANIIKPALARGEMRIIGATTLSEYRQHIEKDAALERRFQAVNVKEPNESEALCILAGLRDKYEAHHKLIISDEAIEAAVKLSVRYIPDRFLPDKAIDLIDEAASKLRIENFSSPSELREIEKRLSELENEKEEAIVGQNFELAASIRDEEAEMRQRKQELCNIDSSKEKDEKLVVRAEDIAEVVTSWTGIPTGKLAENEEERLSKLEEELMRRVVGQENAVRALSSAIRRGRLGLKDEKRPIGSFIFLGRTGVGKTELACALAEALFGSETAMVRLDMSEYMERHSVSKLIGSPPGYVGYDEGGQLTEKIRRRPYSVVLFDEIEKAHEDISDLLLQPLDDGTLTDSQGRRVDFRNCVIIMTSNVGASEAKGSYSLGFAAVGKEEKSSEKMFSALKERFKPEFLNRVDEIIFFNTLTVENIEVIAASMLKKLEKRALAIGLDITFDGSVAKGIAEKSYDTNYGARPLRRTITTDIENVISEKFLSGALKKGERVFARWSESGIEFAK